MVGFYNEPNQLNDLLLKAHPYGGQQVVDTDEGRVEDLVENQLKSLRSVYTDPVGIVLNELAGKLRRAGKDHLSVIIANTRTSYLNSVDRILKYAEPPASENTQPATNENQSSVPTGLVPSNSTYQTKVDEEKWKTVLKSWDALSKNPRLGLDQFSKEFNVISKYYRGIDGKTGKKTNRFLKPEDYKQFLLWLCKSLNPETKLSISREFEQKKMVIAELARYFPDDQQVKDEVLDKEEGGDWFGDTIKEAKEQKSPVLAAQDLGKIKETLPGLLTELLPRMPSSEKSSADSIVKEVIAELKQLDFDDLYGTTSSGAQRLNVIANGINRVSQITKNVDRLKDFSYKLEAVAKALWAGQYHTAVEALGGVAAQDVQAPTTTPGATPATPAGAVAPTQNAPENKPDTQETAPSGQGKKTNKIPVVNKDDDNVDEVTFISPFTGREVKDFPIFFVIRNAIDYPIYWFNQLKAHGVFPPEFTSEDFYSGETHENVQEMQRNIINAMKQQVKGDFAPFQKALGWMSVLYSKQIDQNKEYDKGNGANNETLAWLHKQYPDEMSEILKHQASVKKIMLMMQADNYSTPSGALNTARAEADAFQHIRSIVREVYETMKQSANSQSPEQKSAPGKDVRKEEDPWGYFLAHRREINNTSYFLPGSIYFEELASENRNITAPHHDHPLARSYYTARSIWSSMTPGARHAWLNYQKQGHTQGDTSAIGLNDMQTTNPDLYQTIMSGNVPPQEQGQKTEKKEEQPSSKSPAQQEKLQQAEQASSLWWQTIENLDPKEQLAYLPGSYWYSLNQQKLGVPTAKTPKIYRRFYDNMLMWSNLSSDDKKKFLLLQYKTGQKLAAENFEEAMKTQEQTTPAQTAPSTGEQPAATPAGTPAQGTGKTP